MHVLIHKLILVDVYFLEPMFAIYNIFIVIQTINVIKNVIFHNNVLHFKKRNKFAYKTIKMIYNLIILLISKILYADIIIQKNNINVL